MSISRSAFLSVVLVTVASAAVAADDLAANVAASMKESGALKGYRVNVKAKAGTVWLEGTVSDARQIDAAIAAAEEVPGVERVVNRLTVVESASGDGRFSIPASIRSLMALPALADPPPIETAADRQPAEQAALVDPSDAEGGLDSPIALTRAVESSGPLQPSAAENTVRKTTQAGPRPLASQSAKPLARARRNPGGVQPTSLKRQGNGQPLDLPASGGGYVVTEPVGGDGSYSMQGRVGDGQMVPGSMRFTEGPAGSSCPPGQGGMGGPLPMAAGMRGPLGGSGGAGGMPVPVRGEGPNMPNYAWPSYAAYPNYAALQYPTQYSPTAWPYIGPFYPYPQVPLGWRRVSLEWDDGWWWLDFDERHIHSHHR